MLPPSLPVLLEPSPCRPRSALCSGLKRKCTSVLWRSLDSMITSPPRPPSPPEGPPRGTNFSRRKAMQPLPPSPAFTRIRASSMNMKTASDTSVSKLRLGPSAMRVGAQVVFDDGYFFGLAANRTASLARGQNLSSQPWRAELDDYSAAMG